MSINWNRYHLCVHPLHIWIVVRATAPFSSWVLLILGNFEVGSLKCLWIQVDYSSVFVFRLLMFVDNGLAAGMGL